MSLKYKMFQMAEKCALKFFSKWLILSKSDSKQRIMVSNSSQVTYLQKITLIIRKMKKGKIDLVVSFLRKKHHEIDSIQFTISTVGQ